jgi:hypothetical protein
MNIFVLSLDPVVCSKQHNNAHVIKMILESHTLLQTAHGNKAWRFHPCSKWVRQSINNYRWLAHLAVELCFEYSYRYGKIHKYQGKLEYLRYNEPLLDDIPMTPFYLAMPKELWQNDAVEAYREYYRKYKRHLAKWKNRMVPIWYT